MIHAHALAIAFGKNRVLDGIDLSVRPGERVAVLGLNGAGKTTLMRCLLGLVRFEGALEVAGVDVRRAGRNARARLGYVPQRAPQFEGSLAEVVEFFAKLRGVARADVEARLEQFELPLSHHADKAVRALSGGMLQKLLLAFALGNDVPLLLLDEPTANLDHRARREFVRALRQIDRSTTVLLASHRLRDVEALADRLVVLHRGRIAFDGSARALRSRAGAAATLWVRVAADSRPGANERLKTRLGIDTILSNGAALGVRGDTAVLADVLQELHAASIPVEEFWTEAPSLHDLLEGALDGHGEAS